VRRFFIYFLFVSVIVASCNTTKKLVNSKSESHLVLVADNSVIAHRSAWKKNNLPENSIASLRQANNFNYSTTDEPELLFERERLAAPKNVWNLVWSDEFNYTGLPDSTKWKMDIGGHGWGNNEKQFYLDNSLENSFVKDGILHLVALKKEHDKNKYTSAKATTYQKFVLQYGKVEVMAKLPRGKGTWPAIWMLPESLRKKEEKWPLCGEIDIMEHVGKDPNMVHVSLHTELYNHIKGTQITHFERQNNVFDNFHKYGIEWDKDSISFFIDDKPFYTTKKGENGRVAANEGWPFDKPYYLILNLAIGGNWGGEIDDSIFPCEMQIDFVRIYKKSENNKAK
jgi:beta-glucanase (GH16 family)